MTKTLFYAHDPMCSWCWGFEPVRKQLFNNLPKDIALVRLVGGLAPDSSEPMPKEMQLGLQGIWKNIQQEIPNTEFNYNFWSECQPRRSTYPANRAVLAAKLQGENFDEIMTRRIQQAYYTEAKNPSDHSLLIELASDIGLNTEQFAEDLTSDAIQLSLEQNILKARSLGLRSFPSLAYQVNQTRHHIKLDYNNANTMLNQIKVIDSPQKNKDIHALKLIMKSEFDDLRLNDNHEFEADSNGNKQVVKIYCQGKLIAKKLKIKKTIRYFGVDGYSAYLSND